MKSRVVLALYQILSLILINVYQLRAACNSCTANTQMACVSETEYQFCVNDIPSGTGANCPTGYVCSTATDVICLPKVVGNEASCNECNKCDASLVFACTGVNTYALCIGSTSPTADIHTCPSGQVCNINSPLICSPEGTVSPTCPSAANTEPTAATPTPAFPPTVPTYPEYFCNVMRQNKRFQVPTEFDNTCKRYIYCFLTREGTWSGQIYTCAGSTYFDLLSLYCVADRPSSC